MREAKEVINAIYLNEETESSKSGKLKNARNKINSFENKQRRKNAPKINSTE